MLARKGSDVHKHQPICLLRHRVTTLGKITVTQPTPLSLEVFASCFNEVHLTVLILMHSGIMVPQSLARHNRAGVGSCLPDCRNIEKLRLEKTFKISWSIPLPPTSPTVVKLSSSCLCVRSGLAHCEVLYLEVLVWDSPNGFCI